MLLCCRIFSSDKKKNLLALVSLGSSSAGKWGSSHLFSFHCCIFMWTSAGVLLRDALFRRAGAGGCCCNPQAAEQNPSRDFTAPSPISSLPHLLVLSSPHHLFSMFGLCSLERLLRFRWWAPVLGSSLSGAELIAKMSKQVERWAGRSAINNSAALDWCRAS